MKMIICRGVSASGKSTFAKELCEEDSSFVEINRDWIRFNVISPGGDWGSYKFSSKKEREVTEIQKEMAMDAYAKEKNIVLSDTNLSNKTLQVWLNIAGDLGYDVEIKYFHITFEEAVRRDNLRANGVGQAVIYKQWLKWLGLQGLQKHMHSPDKRDAIICDLDGTLAFRTGNRSWYDWMRVGEDDVNTFLAETLNHYSCGADVIIVSGRDSVCREVTEKWLISNDVAFNRLFMRQEGDNRKDSIIKMEIYNKYLKDKYNIIACFDDRPQVLRDVWIPLGIKTYTVGNFMEEF